MIIFSNSGGCLPILSILPSFQVAFGDQGILFGFRLLSLPNADSCQVLGSLAVDVFPSINTPLNPINDPLIIHSSSINVIDISHLESIHDTSWMGQRNSAPSAPPKGWSEAYEQWDKSPIYWCKISSIRWITRV